MHATTAIVGRLDKLGRLIKLPAITASQQLNGPVKPIQQPQICRETRTDDWGGQRLDGGAWIESGLKAAVRCCLANPKLPRMVSPCHLGHWGGCTSSQLDQAKAIMLHQGDRLSSPSRGAEAVVGIRRDTKVVCQLGLCTGSLRISA